jgi:hypothetical protein
VPETEAAQGSALDLGTHWRWLIDDWVTRNDLQSRVHGAAVSVLFEVPQAGRLITVRFMTTTTTRLLVAFMTDDQILRPDQLAIAAAAANAWNTEQLIPMLSVWDVRGPRPCLAGVCSLPLSCRMTSSDFGALATDWKERGRQMFVRCREVFGL